MNPLYNGIRYNSKIHYNVILICTKNHWIEYFFIDNPMLLFGKTYTFGYLLELPHRGDSNKYTKRMIYKRTIKKYPLLKFLYNSKFDFTAKSLVTNTVIVTRVLCSFKIQKMKFKIIKKKKPYSMNYCYIFIYAKVYSCISPVVYCNWLFSRYFKRA